MSHPILVDAADSAFVPVVVHNNTKDDAMARVRERFREPAWNNPVVRVIDAERESDLAAKVGDRWTTLAVADAMVEGLERARRRVPVALRLLRDETRAHTRGVESAIFGMT